MVVGVHKLALLFLALSCLVAGGVVAAPLQRATGADIEPQTTLRAVHQSIAGNALNLAASRVHYESLSQPVPKRLTAVFNIAREYERPSDVGLTDYFGTGGAFDIPVLQQPPSGPGAANLCRRSARVCEGLQHSYEDLSLIPVAGVNVPYSFQLSVWPGQHFWYLQQPEPDYRGPSAVPLPAGIVLLVSALAGLLATRRKR